MKLSIITINLNNESGLQQTIESVVNQSFSDYEFIIIDGNSADGSVELIKKYQDKITYWISEPDKGIYNAMNKGIRQASGEYCYFLNSGDRLASDDVLEKLFEDDPHAPFICGNFYQEVNGKLIEDTSYRNRDWHFALYDIFSHFLCHQAFMIKKASFDHYGMYNEDLRVMSDWEHFFVAIGLNHEEVLYKDILISIYNMEGFSTQIGGEVIYKEKLLVANKYLKPSLVKKLERMYYLEQNSFITDIVRSRNWIFWGFRGFCKIGRILGFVKS